MAWSKFNFRFVIFFTKAFYFVSLINHSELTIIFEAMTLGSSHTDSMKKTCSEMEPSSAILIWHHRPHHTSLSHWVTDTYGSDSAQTHECHACLGAGVTIATLTLKQCSLPKSRIMSRLSRVVFVASNTWTQRRQRTYEWEYQLNTFQTRYEVCWRGACWNADLPPPVPPPLSNSTWRLWEQPRHTV